MLTNSTEEIIETIAQEIIDILDIKERDEGFSPNDIIIVAGSTSYEFSIGEEDDEDDEYDEDDEDDEDNEDAPTKDDLLDALRDEDATSAVLIFVDNVGDTCVYTVNKFGNHALSYITKS